MSDFDDGNQQASGSDQTSAQAADQTATVQAASPNADYGAPAGRVSPEAQSERQRIYAGQYSGERPGDDLMPPGYLDPGKDGGYKGGLYEGRIRGEAGEDHQRRFGESEVGIVDSRGSDELPGSELGVGRSIDQADYDRKKAAADTERAESEARWPALKEKIDRQVAEAEAQKRANDEAIGRGAARSMLRGAQLPQ